jgi:hypothetical protein
MDQNTSSPLLSLKPTFYLIILSGAFLILIGVSFDFDWLKNLLDSYAVDGNCQQCNPLTSFDMIIPAIGATIILLAVLYRKEVLEENSAYLKPFICLLFLILSIYPIHAQVRILDHDEYEHMHRAWLMVRGTIPFFTPEMTHTPLVNWLVVLIIKICGENVSIIKYARQIMYILSLLSLLVVYLITKELFNNKAASYVALLFVTTNFVWFYTSYEIRPDNFMLFFALCSFLFLLLYHKTSYVRYLLLFFLMAFLSTLGKQNSAVFYLALLIAFSYNIFFQEQKYRLLFFACLFCFVVIVVGVPPIRNFFEVNISRHLVPNEEKFWPTYFLKQAFLFNPLFFIMFVLHFFITPKTIYSHVVLRNYIYSIIFTCFGFLFFMNRPWMQEMLVMTVFMCIVTSGSIIYFFERTNIPLKYMIIVLILSSIPFFSSSKLIFFKSRKQLYDQIEVTRCIGSISNTKDKVFDSYGRAIFREHPLDPEFTNFNPESFYRLEKLRSSNFRFLVKDEYFERLPTEVLSWFDENFRMSKINEVIFVRKMDLDND